MYLEVCKSHIRDTSQISGNLRNVLIVIVGSTPTVFSTSMHQHQMNRTTSLLEFLSPVNISCTMSPVQQLIQSPGVSNKVNLLIEILLNINEKLTKYKSMSKRDVWVLLPGSILISFHGNDCLFS